MISWKFYKIPGEYSSSKKCKGYKQASLFLHMKNENMKTFLPHTLRIPETLLKDAFPKKINILESF